MVPAAELRIPAADGSGVGHDGELCFAARAGGADAGLCAGADRDSEADGLDGFAETGAHVCDERAAAGIHAGRENAGRGVEASGGREQGAVQGVDAFDGSGGPSGSGLQRAGGAGFEAGWRSQV